MVLPDSEGVSTSVSVLTAQALPCTSSGYAVCGTDIVDAAPSCYTAFGTGIGYAATSSRAMSDYAATRRSPVQHGPFTTSAHVISAIRLRTSYAMPGTDTAYADGDLRACYAMPDMGLRVSCEVPDTDVAYGATATLRVSEGTIQENLAGRMPYLPTPLLRDVRDDLAHDTRCRVLTCRMLLSDVSGGGVSLNGALVIGGRAQALGAPAIHLRACYAKSGTDVGPATGLRLCAAMSGTQADMVSVASAKGLCASYAMSGTDIGCSATRLIFSNLEVRGVPRLLSAYEMFSTDMKIQPTVSAYACPYPSADREAHMHISNNTADVAGGGVDVLACS
eukprot:3934640-Rhodomonas_salina.1